MTTFFSTGRSAYLVARRTVRREVCGTVRVSRRRVATRVWRVAAQSVRIRHRRATSGLMGCLPVLLLFPLGAGVCYLVGGDVGALWGSGLGMVLGLLLMGLLIRAMRQR